MAIKRLERRAVERVWGQRRLPPGFAECEAKDAPIGEIWFEGDQGDALLVKYLFTAERLSIQVHPDDEAARARGLPHGKDELWLVLDAEPDAVIGLGLRREVSSEALRAAARDGSLEALIDWRTVRAGEAIYSPAGTIHAIGAGLALIEIQQNLDLTYRLYDYGRPRELHLDEAVAVARPEPFAPAFSPHDNGPGRRILAAGGAFVVERVAVRGRFRIGDAARLWLIPVEAGGSLDGEELAAGTVWRVDGGAALDADGGVDLLAAYPGAAERDWLSAA